MGDGVRCCDAAAVFCITPTGSLGGIWQSGHGPAVDSSEAIYFEVRHGSRDGQIILAQVVPECRDPPFLIEHGTGAEMNHVKAEHAAGVPVVSLEDVNGFSTHNSPWTADIKVEPVEQKQF
jgi:hypothetical protein